MVTPEGEGGPRSSLAPRVPHRADDCVPWNGTKSLNESALTIRQMPKPTAHRAVGIVFILNKIDNNARCAEIGSVVVSAKLCDELSLLGFVRERLLDSNFSEVFRKTLLR